MSRLLSSCMRSVTASTTCRSTSAVTATSSLNRFASVASASSSRLTQRSFSASSSSGNKHPHVKSQASVVGSPLSHSLDLSQASIGQTIQVPYVSTVSESEIVTWMSTFQVHDRLFTSTPFAQGLNLPQRVLPMYMILFKAISMGHVDESREVLDIGFDHATYIRPAYAGDTLRQTFTIKHLANTSNKENTLLTVTCELHNQRDQLIFTVDKIMLYPGVSVPQHRLSVPPKNQPERPRSHLMSHLLYNSDNLSTNNILALINENQLILHSFSRPIGKSSNMSLSTLNRWTHPSIFNFKRFKDEELIVPGGLVLSAAVSASSRGLFETLSESLDSCVFLNKVSPVDLIGAISYVHSIKQLKEGIEEVTITTLGLKNIDVARELSGVSVPKELFTHKLHRKQIETLVQEKCPILSDKIVVKATRTVVRQSPFTQQRSIPLL